MHLKNIFKLLFVVKVQLKLKSMFVVVFFYVCSVICFGLRPLIVHETDSGCFFLLLCAELYRQRV